MSFGITDWVLFTGTNPNIYSVYRRVGEYIQVRTCEKVKLDDMSDIKDNGFPAGFNLVGDTIIFGFFENVPNENYKIKVTFYSKKLYQRVLEE